MAVSPEALLISSILNVQNGGMRLALAQGASSNLFHAYADEFAWLEKYYSKHRRTPTKVAFKRAFPDFVIRKTDDIDHFVEEVRKSHSRYALTSMMRDVADLVGTGDLDGAVHMMQSSIVTIASGIGSIKDTDMFSDYGDIYKDVKRRKEAFDTTGRAGIPTGLDTVDGLTGGVQPGQSWIVGARLGEGKSWLLMSMATTAVMAGHRVQFDALEMSRPEVGMRIHNFLSGQVGENIFRSLDLAQGRDFDIRAYREFLRSLKSTIKGQLFVSDDRKLGALEIAAQIERNKPDLVFVDYLTLAKTRGDGGWQDIGALSKDLKVLAGQYGVGIVSATQLNREAGIGKNVPGAEAIGLSDQIGQDADVVVNVKKRTERMLEGLIAKNRHGSSGRRFWVNMDLARGVLGEVSYNRARDIMDEDRENDAQREENS